MRKRRIDAFKIFPRKILIAYFVGILLILVASSLVVIVGLAQASSANFTITNNKYLGMSIAPGTPFTNGTIISEQASRTIYTSSVPETIADGLNNLMSNLSSSFLAYPMTVSLANINGNIPLVVRGLPVQVIQKVLPNIFYAELNQVENWTLLGTLAAKELNAHVGSVLAIEDPLSGTNNPFKLMVDGIYSLGDEADYEALVPLRLGQEMGGLSNGVVNAIVIPMRSNIFEPSLQSLVTSNYVVKLKYSGSPGTIEVVDSSGYAHNILSAPASTSSNSTFIQETFNLSIPFGSYTLVLDQNGIRSTVKEFTPNRNGTTIEASSNEQTGSGISYLYVKNANTSSLNNSPKLINSQNEIILPQSYDQNIDYWIFQVNGGGLYTLVLPNGVNITKFLIIGNATYDPSSSFNLTSTLDISISSPSGLTDAFSINVKDSQSSQVVFSGFTTSTSLSIPVSSNHTYTVSVLSSATNILLQRNVSMSKAVDSISFVFPAIPINLGPVPLSDYASLGIGSPSKNASFNFLIGGAVISAIALLAIVFVLLSLAMIAMSKQLLLSLQKEVKVLKFLFPSRTSIRSRIKFPMFFMLVSATISAVLISFGLFQYFDFSSYVIFLGYGIEQFPIVFVAPVVIALSLVSYAKFTISIDREIHGTRNRN